MIETIHLQLLLATFAGWIGRQQTAVISCLIEENRVLNEQLESGGKRVRFTDDQRRRLAAKGKPLRRKVLCRIGRYSDSGYDPGMAPQAHRREMDLSAKACRSARCDEVDP